MAEVAEECVDLDASFIDNLEPALAVDQEACGYGERPPHRHQNVVHILKLVKEVGRRAAGEKGKTELSQQSLCRGRVRTVVAEAVDRQRDDLEPSPTEISLSIGELLEFCKAGSTRARP